MPSFPRKKPEKKWKVSALKPSYDYMENEIMTKADLEPVISNAPGARRSFIEQFKNMVWYAAHKVNIRTNDRTVEDIYMELWEAVFDDHCRMLRKFSGKCPFASYLCTCLVHKAMDIAESLDRDAKAIVCGLDSLSSRQRCADDRSDDCITKKELLRSVAGTLGCLEPRKALFFRRAFIEEKPTEELMQEFGLASENAVYQWKTRTLEKVRSKVGTLAGK